MSDDASHPSPETHHRNGWRGRVRPSRWLLNPLYLIPMLFAVQAVVWYFGMPVDPTKLGDPTLAQASPRFSSEIAIARYLVLLAALMVGLLAGQSLLPSRPRPADAPGPSRGRVEALLWAARIAGTIAGMAELFYVRHVLANPAMLAGAVQEGAFADVGGAASASRLVGLSSLNNLFIVCSTLGALVATHPAVEHRYARSARRWLIGITVATLLHSLVLSARMFFIYHLCAILGAYVLTRPRAVRARPLVTVFVVGVLLVWTGETLRGGLMYARRHNTPVLSVQTQRHVLDRLVMAYVASDFNNAMMILNDPPSMQFVSTSLFSRALARPVPYELPGSFGTVNTLALWWYDWGWMGIAVAFLAGAWMSFSYAAALRQVHRLGAIVPFFMLTYPGCYACTRINFFGNTIFVASAGYLVAMTILLRLLLRLKAERAERARSVPAPGPAAG